MAFVTALTAVLVLVPALASDASTDQQADAQNQPSATFTDAQGRGAPPTQAELDVLQGINSRVAASAEADAAGDDPLTAPIIGPPATQAELEQAQQRWEQEHPRSNLADRNASASAYQDLDRQSASSLFEREFPFLVDVPATPNEILGGDPQHYIGDDAAVVETSEGDHQVVVSQAPLSVDQPDGSRDPVDMSLVSHGQDFVPESSADPTAIPKDIHDGLPLGPPTVELNFPTPGDAGTGTRIGDSTAVFYPDVATDTDLIVRPTASGIEFTLQLRSARSPEHFSLPIDLPAGAVLSTDPDTGLTSIETASEQISISPPIVLDADGYVHDSSVESAGGRLVIDAPHHGHDAAYPLVVDPVVTDVMTFDSGAENWGCANYPVPNTSTYGNYLGTLYGSGLLILAQPGNYVQNEREICSYAIPHIFDNTTAFFSTARWNWSFNRGPAPNRDRYWPYLDMGLYSINGYYLNRYPVTRTGGNNIALSTNDSSSKQILFENGGGQGGTVSPPNSLTSYLYDATAYITDNDTPGVGLFGTDAPATGWVDESHTYTASVLGADSGLGVKAIYMTVDGLPTQTVNQKTPNTTTDCVGIREPNKCPNWGGASTTFSTASLSNGAHQIYSSAQDVAGNSSNPFASVATVRVDKTNPDAPALSGPLAPGSTQQGNTLTVNGTDAQSGVKSITLTIDGQPAPASEVTGGAPQDCPNINAGGCGRTLTFTPTTTSLYYAPGNHTLTATVTDQVGKPSSQSWTKVSTPSACRVIDSAELARLETLPQPDALYNYQLWLGTDAAQQSVDVLQGVMEQQFGVDPSVPSRLSAGFIGVAVDDLNQQLRVVIDPSLVSASSLQSAIDAAFTSANIGQGALTVIVVGGCNSGSSLSDAYNYVDGKQWQVSSEPRATSYEVNPNTSQVDVTVSSGAPQSKATVENHLGNLVSVVTGAVTRDGRQDDAQPHSGGAGIRASSDSINICTSAFTAVMPNGEKGSVTTGHCFTNGQTIRSGTHSYGEAVGESDYPKFDMIRIQPSGDSFQNKVYGTPGTPVLRDVTGSGNPANGALVCLSGMVTEQVCGVEVFNLDAKLCDESGDCTPNLAKAHKPGALVRQPGDSGAPVYQRFGGNARIKGMHVGGSRADHTYFEKVNVIKEHLNVGGIGG